MRHFPSDPIARVGAMVSALVLVPALALAADAPASVDEALIPRYRSLDPRLGTGEAPTPAGLAKLEALGFKAVIDLRTDAEGRQAEVKALKDAGLAYFSIPVTAESFSKGDVEAAQKVLADPANRPVFMHCSNADRTGGMVAALKLLEGTDREKSEAAGEISGLTSQEMVDAVHRVTGK